MRADVRLSSTTRGRSRSLIAAAPATVPRTPGRRSSIRARSAFATSRPTPTRRPTASSWPSTTTCSTVSPTNAVSSRSCRGKQVQAARESRARSRSCCWKSFSARSPMRSSTSTPKHDAVVEPLVRVLQRTSALERVCIASFSDRRLAALRARLGPRVLHVRRPGGGPAPADAGSLRRCPCPRGRIACVQVPLRCGRVPIVDARFVDFAHRQGTAVHVWTIDDPAVMQAAARPRRRRHHERRPRRVARRAAQPRALVSGLTPTSATFSRASSTPGFKMPSGSKARLMARNSAISSALRLRCSHCRFARPMPCSALIEPSALGHGSQHDLVDRFVVFGDPGDVDVDVAVAGVTEQPHLRVRSVLDRPARGRRS